MQTNEMETATFSQRGEALFDSRLRAALDTPENSGKGLAIEVDSGDYEIHQSKYRAADALRTRHPDKIFYLRRLGPNPFSHLLGGRAVGK